MKTVLIPLKLAIYIFITFVVFLLISIFAVVGYPHYANDTFSIDMLDIYNQVRSDTRDGGKSIVKKFSDNGVEGFDCSMFKGDDFPFCISSFYITKSDFEGLDISKYQTIKIYADYEAPTNFDLIRISLRGFNYEYSKMNEIETYTHNLVEKQAYNLENPIEVNLNELIVPHWWQANMMEKRVRVNGRVDISNVPIIDIGTGTNASVGTHKIRVKRIEFERKIISIEQLYKGLFIIWISIILILFISVSVYLALKLKRNSRNEKSLLSINKALSLRSEELERNRKIDELTGVLNRVGMQEQMMHCLQQNFEPVAVAMIDIDHFKKINDNYGHLSGDYVLTQFGKLLKEFIQADESVSRYGGEEFIILIPNSNLEILAPRLEQLRQRISQHDMRINKQVTISIGVAIEIKNIEFNRLINNADKALYDAKNSGRNQIKFFQEQDDTL